MKKVEKVRCDCRSSAKCAYCMMRDGQLDVRRAANGVVERNPWYKMLYGALLRRVS